MAPPPLFTSPDIPGKEWRSAFGVETGAEAWERLVEASTERSREEPAVSVRAWEVILELEQIRRARRWWRMRQACEGDPKRWGQVLAADRLVCASDSWHWLHHYAQIEDPHATTVARRVMPMVPWPAQVRMVDWLLDGIERGLSGDGGEIRVLNKGRKLGASWICSLLLLHRWLFEPQFSALIGSTTLGDVDNGTTQSIMGKIRFALDRQPAHLRPDYPSEYRRETDAVGDVSCKLTNRASGATIVAKAMTKRFGRGGRPVVFWRDESAHVHPTIQSAVRASTESIAVCEWTTSTPNGPGDDFHRQWRATDEAKRVELSWAADPRRFRSWFESLLLENGGRLTWDQREQEHRCSFAGVSGIRIWHPPEESSLLYRPDALTAEERRTLPGVGGMDFGSGPSPTVYVHLLLDWRDVAVHPEWGQVPLLRADAMVSGTRAEPHEIARDVLSATERYHGAWSVYGDPSGKAVTVTQESWESALGACGLPVMCLPADPYADRVFILRAIDFVDWLLQTGRLVINRELEALHRAVQSWQWDVPQGLAIELVNRAQIGWRKDAASHYCEALWYAAVSAVRMHQPAGRPAHDTEVPSGLGDELEGVFG